MTPSWPVLRYLDADVVLLIDLVEQSQTALHDLEESLTVGATALRLRELHAGRSTARRALLALGESATGILAGACGEPQWPAGICGSLSHTLRHAAALVARRSQYASVGVDIDDGRPLGDAAAADVVWRDELALVQRLGIATSEITAQNFVFIAKEAIFKCQYPVTLQRSLDFLDVRLIEANEGGALMPQAVVEDDQLRSLLVRVRVFSTNIQGVSLAYALLRS
jgi:4'-phosphopantetheinyl transferase EntD